jgi:uncharacterized protein YqgC (DUF456 family)
LSAGGLILVALAIAVGLAGVLVPFLPGSLLVWAAIAVWAYVEHTTHAWIVLGMASAVLAAGILLKYLWPARRMRAAEVSTRTLLAGAAGAVVGFFVIPVAGLLVGFVLGVFLAELVQRRDVRRAWAATLHAVKGVALAVGVELGAALLAAAVWVVGVLT